MPKTDPQVPIQGIELGSTAFWASLKEGPEQLAAAVCTVDVVNLDLTLQTHPALRAWVNAAWETCRIHEEKAKWEHDKARARALLLAKAKKKDKDTDKPKTIQVLDAEVEVDDVVLETMADLLEVREKLAVLRAMAKALEDRKDMLIQISAKQRREQDDYR